MTLTVKKCVAAAAVMLALVSCSDFDNDWDAKRIQYKENFENLFGLIDPNHTWNTAVQGVINVDVPSGKNYTVKMYTANPRYSDKKSYMIGEFRNVDGGKQIAFNVDMPSNLEYVYVGLIDNNGDRIILPAKLEDGKNACVSFPSIGTARTRVALPENSNAVVRISEPAEKYEFGYEDILPVLETLPEKNNNVGNVTQNLCYVSMGPFTIYPMYSVTDNQGKYSDGLVLGVYYYDNNGVKQCVDVWKKKDTWLEAYNYHAEDNQSWAAYTGYTSYAFTFANGEGINAEGTPTGFISTIKKLRSTGITINIPKGTKFGFYLGISGINGGDDPDDNVYSESQINKDVNHKSYDDFQCYAASFHHEGQLFLCFEDWYYQYAGTDRDFNDIVFGFYGSTADPVIIDKDEVTETMQYIVACEDLGGTDDFDFNDVVFGIRHASGQNEAHVQLRAAGGILPATIKYNGNSITFATGSKTEVHDVFGVETSQMVNTGLYNADFKISDAFAVDANAFTIVNDASKFSVEVTYSDGAKSDLQIPNDAGSVREPQAFLVADPEWIWPSERTNIETEYPEFTNWVSNHLSSSWCDAVWGSVNEIKTIPQSATNLLTAPSGTIAYTTQDNVATVTIPNSCFVADEVYELVMKPTSACDVLFTLGGENMSIMPNGTVQAGKVTTFTFNAAASNAIKTAGQDVVVTFKFANGVNASEKMALLYWTGESQGGSGPFVDPYEQYGEAISVNDGGDYSGGVTLPQSAFADYTSGVELTVITLDNGSCQLVSNGSWIGQSMPVGAGSPKTFELTEEMLGNAKEGKLVLYVWTATVKDLRIKGTK